MATILEDMYVVSLISETLTEIDISEENFYISGYNSQKESKKIPAGIINAMIKIFLADEIGIGVTKDGEIYTELMGDSKDEVVAVLYNPTDKKLKACRVDKNNISTGKTALVKSGLCPPYLMVPYLAKQRILDKYKELENAWDEVTQTSEESGFTIIASTEGAACLIDSAVCGALKEFNFNVGQVELLSITPSEVYDYTPHLLMGKDGSFVMAKAVPKPENAEPLISEESNTYQAQMKALKAEVWPLVKDYYEQLTDEEKALVPDENRLGIYIPTQRFKDIVHIVADGIRNGDMDSQNILLKGPPGVGKSVMAVALAYVFSMPYRFTQSYKTADASEYIGTTIADNGVLKTNIQTQFAQTVMRGGVHSDEDNNYAAEGESTVKNSILIAPYTIKLADGTMAKRHPFSIFMMSANPDMKGARPINEAYKDRFCVIVDLTKLSQNEMVKMVMERSHYEDEGIITRMVEAWEKINADISTEGESADMLTPRSLVNWAKQTRIIGDPVAASDYNVLAALCSSEEYKVNVLNTIIRPLFGRRK